MPFVIFAAPMLSENASRMIEAAASLPDVRLAIVSQDPMERAPPWLHGKVAAHWRVDDVLNAGHLVNAAQQLARAHGPIHRMFGAFEQMQVPLAEAREFLGVPGMRMEAARNFRDKSRMKDILRAHGLPCARHRLAESEADAWAFAGEVGFPIVVKPPAGAGAQATYRVDRPDQLRDALEVTRPGPGRAVLLEEFIVGDEHSFETISVGGRAVWHSLTHYYPTPLEVLRNPWIQWVVVLPREADDPRYADIGRAAVRALEVLGMETGLSHMEWFRRRDGSVAISEVAARPPGAQITTLISRANDVDFLRIWANLMVFDAFEPPQRKYAVGAAYLRGQGSGHVRAIHGLDAVEREVGPLITDHRLPAIGQPASVSYEGEGYIILRHPETRVVEEAIAKVVSLVRVELG
jgi:biotin carboxylase